ncbi:hypothetical protein TNCV_4574131 [Trichonephila clavipes]|nr:hypothetical protein TNCV_4574131 [Trichonephila clavipes]
MHLQSLSGLNLDSSVKRAEHSSTVHTCIGYFDMSTPNVPAYDETVGGSESREFWPEESGRVDHGAAGIDEGLMAAGSDILVDMIQRCAKAQEDTVRSATTMRIRFLTFCVNSGLHY